MDGLMSQLKNKKQNTTFPFKSAALSDNKLAEDFPVSAQISSRFEKPIWKVLFLNPKRCWKGKL